MSNKDRLCIKINEHLTIAARDVRNIEVRYSVSEEKGGKPVRRTKVGYASSLAGALKLCINEVPLYSNAKNLKQLKADYEQFVERVEQIVQEYRLPDAKQLLGASEENPRGLYGEDLRKDADDDFPSEVDDFDTEDLGDDWDDNDDDDWD